MNKLVAFGQFLGGAVLWLAAVVAGVNALKPLIGAAEDAGAPSGATGALVIVLLLAGVGTWLMRAGWRRLRARAGGHC
ncbi:hypothetical protein CS062_06265 [Roseateles chitinivorans]|uniref:Uncharacterized protein n=1 Tax=Roseateles chitinivorans TaxID=2917965 RepID=A0A2G9CCC3_9BURK|nr:hypothetical protein [Roseateles chitinivorans]PIM54071.1 hypothetical protein CS062_06265 [Roseateles chitinivorans]